MSEARYPCSFQKGTETALPRLHPPPQGRQTSPPRRRSSPAQVPRREKRRRSFPLRLSRRFPSHSFTSLRRDTRMRLRSPPERPPLHHRPACGRCQEKQVGGDHAAAVAAARPMRVGTPMTQTPVNIPHQKSTPPPTTASSSSSVISGLRSKITFCLSSSVKSYPSSRCVLRDVLLRSKRLQLLLQLDVLLRQLSRLALRIPSAFTTPPRSRFSSSAGKVPIQRHGTPSHRVRVEAPLPHILLQQCPRREKAPESAQFILPTASGRATRFPERRRLQPYAALRRGDPEGKGRYARSQSCAPQAHALRKLEKIRRIGYLSNPPP